MKQTTFASVAWDKKGKVTRRERFLGGDGRGDPLGRLLALIEPHYPKAGNGTQPMPMERMLRIYFMQQWFNLSDPRCRGLRCTISESMRRFAGIELVEDAMPDESTILRFRHLLEKHQLTEQIFGQVRTLLEQKRLLLKSGTIVDATIIEAPPSTKNEAKARDPEMKQTKKGKEWHFGMKAHVGTDRARHRAQAVTTTPANVLTSASCPSCCTGRSGSFTGIRPTGASFTAMRPGPRGALPRQPPRHAGQAAQRLPALSTAAAPRPGRAASMPSTS